MPSSRSRLGGNSGGLPDPNKLKTPERNLCSFDCVRSFQPHIRDVSARREQLPPGPHCFIYQFDPHRLNTSCGAAPGSHRRPRGADKFVWESERVCGGRALIDPVGRGERSSSPLFKQENQAWRSIKGQEPLVTLHKFRSKPRTDASTAVCRLR